MEVNYFQILLIVLFSTCFKADMQYADKNLKKEYNRFKG